MTTKDSETINPWRFFIFAIGISWFFWSLIILLNWNVFTFPAIILGAFGLFGPAFAEIILILRAHNKEQWEDYWHRVFDFRRIGKKWYLVIGLTFPLLNAVTILISTSVGLPTPGFETLRYLLQAPWQIIPLVIFILLFGPLPEELGWRGYALDGLQAQYNALVSSIILGIIWAIWHIPLFFMEGTYQHDILKFGTSGFWAYIIGPVIISILFTWIYNNTYRSTLSAILFHFMINFTGELVSLPSASMIYSSILVVVLSIIVVTIWGPDTLTRQKSKDPSHLMGNSKSDAP